MSLPPESEDAELPSDECRRLLAERQDALANRHLHTIETLTRSLCHEFGNTLSGMLGYAQLASANMDDAELVRNALDSTVRNAKRGGEMLARMNHFAYVDDSAPTSVGDPTRCLEDCVELFRPEALHQGIDIQTSFVPQPPIRHSSGHLRMVFVEVLQNAFDALLTMPEGQRLLRIETLSTEEEAVIHIIDSGAGLKGVDVERLFDPFHSTRDILSGVDDVKTRGLGLSIARSMLRRLGGSIALQSPPDGGAITTIRLPKSQEGAEGGLRVLAVDDDAATLKIYERFLQREGYQVIACSRPEAALDALRTSVIDLVILDHLMPGMSGLDLLATMREEGRAVPVIMVTASNRPDVAREALALGAREVMSKPISRAKLLFLCAHQLQLDWLGESGVRLASDEMPSERILVIDSEPLTRDVMGLCLRRTGYVTTEAEGMASALQATKEEYYDLILIDPCLHDGFGIEAVRGLRHNNPYTPIVALTTTGEGRQTLETLQAGATHAIAKPVDVFQILADVETILNVFRPSSLGE